MSCDARHDAIFLHAADELDPVERDALVGHLETGCLACGDALVQAREALALLAHSLEPVAPPERALSRLLDRVAARSAIAAPRDAVARARPPRRRSAESRRVALAAGIGLVLGVALSALVAWRLAVAPLSERSAALERALDEKTAELAERDEAIAEQDRDLLALEADAQQAARSLRLLSARDLEVMALSAASSARDAKASLFWERSDYDCYLHAERMPPLAPGRIYELWLVSTRDELLAAARFAPDPRGEVGLLTKLPRSFPPVARALVTDEPADVGPQPTGAVLLVGSGTEPTP
jgi:hypothetical protein